MRDVDAIPKRIKSGLWMSGIDLFISGLNYLPMAFEVDISWKVQISQLP